VRIVVLPPQRGIVPPTRADIAAFREMKETEDGLDFEAHLAAAMARD